MAQLAEELGRLADLVYADATQKGRNEDREHDAEQAEQERSLD